jgi:hypothetical protein
VQTNARINDGTITEPNRDGKPFDGYDFGYSVVI